MMLITAEDRWRKFFEGKTICVLGPSGCGKGTQCACLKTFIESLGLSVHHTYLGDIFREMRQEDSDRGKEIRRCLGRGLFPPEWIAGEIIVESLKPVELQPAAVVIYDGSPRKLDEAKMLDARLQEMNRDPALAIHLSVPFDVCHQRLIVRGREDDTEDRIQNRLSEFHEFTVGVLSYFGQKGNCVDIEGDRSPAVVRWDVLRSFEQFM